METRREGARGGAERELRVHDALTAAGARDFCTRVRASLPGAQRLWVNLEDVKAVDAVGLAALAQTVRAAHARAVSVTVLPSPAVHRALLVAGLLDELPLGGVGTGPAATAEVDEPDRLAGDAGVAPLARAARVHVRPPTWGELALFGDWARERLLDEMVGSELLYLCRHLGPWHPDFVARALHDPTALTLLVCPEAAPEPAGFVRLYGVHLVERFAFLETVVVHPRATRAGLGIEASRLALAYAMDTLELHRVESKVYAYNALSVNALRRNGFQEEGVLRDARTWDGRRWDILVFAILREAMERERAREGFPYLGFWPADADP
jgi:RimJ/RimL family protein N-acetyltransferase/anti-anti-sigma regulatory factor